MATDTWTASILSGTGPNHNTQGLSNQISTTKYSILTWLPKSLWEQFRRVANAYFLLISILMIIGTYATYLWQTPLDAWSTVATLVFVLLVTSIKEGYEDVQRAKSDSEDNNKKETVIVFDSNGLKREVPKKRKDIQAGDIVYLKGYCSVPCDMLVLHTALYSDGNQCYVETANIDGETNLKLKEAPPDARSYIVGDEPSKELFTGSLEFEPPNKSIYTFSGALTLSGSGKAVTIPLGPANVLLRGSVFANTDWAYGVAIYTGQETKLQMNNRHAPSKLSKIELYANNAIKIIFLAKITLVSITVISIYILGFNDYNSALPYVYPAGTSRTSILPLWLEYWVVFFLLFNNLIPISLYVTLELVNLGQALFVYADVEIYDPVLDCPCNVRSSNLCQELGLVSNIFSDKTGTLTRNEMNFVQFIVGGVNYDVITGRRHAQQYREEEMDKDSSISIMDVAKKGASGDGVDSADGTMYDFLRCISICHTVILEKSGTYRAESPDELALVEGVAKFNFKLTERSTSSVYVSLLGDPQQYSVLAVNAFNSDRKRMSVLVQGGKSKQFLLLCKGADSTMLPLCTVPASERADIDKQLYDLSCFGLRTLCIAHKPISDTQAADWLGRYKQAQASLRDREAQLEALGAEIEVDMTLLGVTAVEDRLQDEVPEVIAELAKAGIVLWMLTGDKQETAINIGNSCNLLTRHTKTFFLCSLKNEDEYAFRLQEIVDDLEAKFVVGSGYAAGEGQGFIEVALIMDGPSFSFFSEEDITQRNNLLKVCSRCRSVVACRLTPRQKQALVALVKRGPFVAPKYPILEKISSCYLSKVSTVICLSIGDGANDVSMIREADVGVGIYGKEGKQAANSADFAIGQFKFLRRLLLVHGRWNYVRQSRAFLYCAHKNMVLTLTLFWFGYLSAVSGTSIYESWVYSSFNICLGLPIIFFGFMDRDISAATALKYPQMYSTGRKNVYLDSFAVASWILNAWIYAVILCLIYYYALKENFLTYGLFELGTSLFVGLVLSLQLKVAFLHHQWTYVNAIIMAISVLGEFLFLYVLSISSDYSTGGYLYIAQFTYSDPLFWWFSCFTVPLVIILVDALSYLICDFFMPTDEMKYVEIDREGREVKGAGYTPSERRVGTL